MFGLLLTLMISTNTHQIVPQNIQHKTHISYRYNSHDLHIMALTIYGEARGESYAGKVAVANVIKNRYLIGKKYRKHTWGNSISGVCLANKQFSVWNDGGRFLNRVGKNNYHYQQSYAIAKGVMNGSIKDNTYGANHYHATYVKPKWSRRLTHTITIGNHIFYR